MLEALKAVLKLLSGVSGGAIGIAGMLAAYGGLSVWLLTQQNVKYCFSILELSGLGVVVSLIATIIIKRGV